jgi:hypothetical protein
MKHTSGLRRPPQLITLSQQPLLGTNAVDGQVDQQLQVFKSYLVAGVQPPTNPSLASIESGKAASKASKVETVPDLQKHTQVLARKLTQVGCVFGPNNTQNFSTSLKQNNT